MWYEFICVWTQGDKHVMMHTCDQCSQTFTRKSNLTRHKNGRCQGMVNKYERARSPVNPGRHFAGNDHRNEREKSEKLQDLFRKLETTGSVIPLDIHPADETK